MASERTLRATKTEGAESYLASLHFLVASAPVWIRGTVLLTLVGVIVAAVVMFLSAVLSGVAVEFGPVKISERQSPEVRNCQLALSSIPAMQQAASTGLDLLHKHLSTQTQNAQEMRRKAIEYRASSESWRQPIGAVADQQVKEIENAAKETGQKIADASNRIADELKYIRANCFDAFKK